MTPAPAAPTRQTRLGRALTVAGAALAAAGTAHTWWNLRHLRDCPQVGAPIRDAQQARLAVLLPMRNEADRVGPCLAGLAAQDHPSFTVLALDDGSTDGTAGVFAEQVAGDARFRLLHGGREPLPTGWLGKPWACHRLAQAALSGGPAPDLLVFIDADVNLAPSALRRIEALADASGLDLISPHPRQVAITPAERLIQPLLEWSWLTTLPLRLAERSNRPSLAAANGQLLAVRPTAYLAAGGHASVRGEVLEDIGLLRAVKSAGGRANVADGADVAECRMYRDAGELIDGYTKSLWSAFGSPAGAAAAGTLLTVVYVLPPAAALLARSPRTRTLGAAGYAAALGGRWLVARRMGQRVWPDIATHPAAILGFDGLLALSLWRRSRGRTSWKGRPI